MKNAFYILAILFLSGCQCAMELADLPPRPEVQNLVSKNMRPIAYDSATIELKRGTTYVAYPYWRWSFDHVHIGWLDQCNMSIKNRFSASTAEWSTGESAFGGWESEAAIFMETPLKNLGYDVVSHQTTSFRRDREKRRAELLLSAHIVEIQSNICDVFNILYFKDVGIMAGNATILVKWEVFDTLKDEVVATFESRGLGVVEKPTQDGNRLILLRALEDATDALARQPKFQRLVLGQTNVADLLAQEKQQKPIHIQIKQQQSAMLYERIAKVKRSVVQVAEDGTGFFISPDGYILTSLKAVGSAQNVAVTDSQGTRQTAHVIRRNERLGVALLSLSMKNHSFLDVAPEELPKELQEVFTIGNPSDFQARSTLARGTISSWRIQSKKSQQFIQASITTTAGYAGAPLLDEQGRVLGVHDGRNSDETSFSYFIPIHDVLRALNIHLEPV